MEIGIAIRHAYRLQVKWVGSSSVGYDLDRIQTSIRSEMKANRQLPARCTPDCKSETHGDAILLGKIRKALAPSTSFTF